MNQKSIRILIVDDVPHVRQGLAAMLRLAAKNIRPTIEVAGEAQNGMEAVQVALLLHPDVVLMDLEMPVLDGFEATRQIKAGLPGIRVIILSMHASLEDQELARSAGADGFVAKGGSYKELVEAILSDQNSDPEGFPNP